MLDTRVRFEVLDSFRGIAAISVAMTHMHYLGSIADLDFFRGSWLFVEFFFVLSGFVLTHGYAFKENLTFKQFAISRTFRIFPLHISMLFVFLALEIGKFVAEKYGFHFNSGVFSGPTAIREIIPNLFLLQSWTDYTVESFNIPSWSLSIEYYIYMLFFVTLFIKGVARNALWIGIVSVVVYLVLNNIALFTHSVERGLYSFFIGAITYLVYKNIKNHMDKISSYVFSFFELFCAILVIFIVSLDAPSSAVTGPLLFSITILVFSFEKGIISQFFKQKVFLFFGRLSYSIYMTHMAIWVSLMAFFLFLQKILAFNMVPMIEGVRLVDLGSTTLNNVAMLVNLAIILFVSKFTYNNIEVKWQKTGRKLVG